ncbi:MAG: TolC family protein [Thermodesulfovibrionia bacterium]
MIKKLTYLSCLLLILIPYAVFAMEYSLDELFSLALERSEIIKIAEEDLYISELEKDKALAALLPTLSAFGTHTRYTEEKQKVGFTIQPETSNTWGVRMDQSFSLSGKELTGYKITREAIVKNIFDLNAVKEEYLLTVASAYYDVLKSKKALEIASTNVERLTKHRDAASIRLKVGEVTKTVLLRAEAELAGAQSDLIKAANNIRLAKTSLARIVGISEVFDVKESQPGNNSEMPGQEQIIFDFLIQDCQLLTLDCLKEIALTKRAEIKALTIQKKITEKKVKYAKGSYWPTLSVEGVYSKKEDNPASSFEINERIYGGLRFDFPFFEGGLRRAEVREAKAKLRQAQYSLLDLKNSVAVEVENSYLNLITESGILTKLQAEVEYAIDNFNAVSKQFEHGLANSVDIMDANTLLVTAERELANARYNYQLVILNLKRSIGTLLKTVISQQLSE